MTVSAKVASAYIDLVARTEAFEKALGEASSQTRKFKSIVQTEMREAKGSMALLGEEIGVHIPRHLQTFMAKLPGVATAMSAAFNAVAVFALVDIVVKAGEKIYEFAQKNEEAAKKNAEAWDAVNKPLALSNDELRVTNDRLADSIAKLEGKPTNGLKTAIDEAIVSADKLGAKLDADLKKLAGVLKEVAPSVFGGQLFEGQASTQDIQNKYADLQSRILDTTQTGNVAIRAARETNNPQTLKAAQDDLNKKLSDLYTEGANFAKTVIDTARLAQAARKNPNAYPVSYSTGYNSQDMGPRVAAGSGLLDFFNSQKDALDLSTQDTSLNTKKGALEQQKTRAEEEKKADEARMKQFEADFEDERRQRIYWGQSMGVAEERAFWESRLQQFKPGSEQYTAAMKKADDAGLKLSEQLRAARQSTIGVAPEFNKSGVGGTRGEEALNAMITRNTEAQAHLNAAWTEAHDKVLLLTGAITPHQAALDAAAAHATEYIVQLDALHKQLDALKENDALADILGPDKENQAKEQRVQNQIDELAGKGKIQSFIDAQQTLDTTWHGMVGNVFDELIKKSEDTSKQIEQIATHMVDEINGELAKGMTGHKMDFSKIFENASQSLAKTGLEKAEGLGLKALGLGNGHGKADGYHMWIDNLPGGSSSSGVAGAASKGLVGVLNDSNWFGSLFGGRLFGAGGIFGGGHALGGDVAAGVPIDVGEMGRERFVPSVPGRIVPHSQLGGGNVWHIDARGTDPALTQANVARALQATRVQAVHDASRAMMEHGRRVPN
jgi:hypothetical protein